MSTDPKSIQPSDAARNPEDQPAVTHNLDTGRDEPLQSTGDDEDVMDFASGSDGGSAGDGSDG